MIASTGHDDGFAEGADRAAVDLIGDAFEGGQILRAGVAGDDAVGDFLHPRGAFAAGGALAAGFVGVEGVQVVEHPGHFARVVDDDHAAGAGHRAAGGEGVEIERDVPEAELRVRCRRGF